MASIGVITEMTKMDSHHRRKGRLSKVLTRAVLELQHRSLSNKVPREIMVVGLVRLLIMDNSEPVRYFF